MFILAWHSYAEIEDDVDGSVEGVYETLEEARLAMMEEVDDTKSYYEDDFFKEESYGNYVELLGENGYYIKYYITEK